jgi:hypothetical protein
VRSYITFTMLLGTNPKRAVRIVKMMGAAPYIAACTSCGQQFHAPFSALRSVRDAKDNLQKQFDAHKCTPSNARKDAAQS